MDEVARMNSRDRNELFTQTAARIGSTPAVVEKDFWVSWVLKKIFEDEVTAPVFIFKGGTSLSKVFKVIQRFSEDIDLILDWRKLGVEDPLPQGHVLGAVQNDYRQMRNMFFGDVPELDAILQTLTRLEAEINQTEQFAIINQH